MRFLLNMNLPRELGERLGALGHEARHAGDAGLGRAADKTIVAEARAKGEVIVTHDLDYGPLMAFSGEASPSVVIFRLRNTRPENLAAQLIQAWPEIETPLNEGAIVILEDEIWRIRKLPIASH